MNIHEANTFEVEVKRPTTRRLPTGDAEEVLTTIWTGTGRITVRDLRSSETEFEDNDGRKTRSYRYWIFDRIDKDWNDISHPEVHAQDIVSCGGVDYRVFQVYNYAANTQVGVWDFDE